MSGDERGADRAGPSQRGADTGVAIGTAIFAVVVIVGSI